MDKNSVIELINTHIDEIKTETKEPGWSTWALLLGFCSIAFLLYNDWKSFEGNLNYVLILGFAEYCILDFICGIVFMRKHPISGDQLFVKPAAEAFSLSCRRAFLLVVYMCFFMWVNYNYNLYEPLKFAIYIYLGFMVLFCLLIIMFSLFNFPIVTSKRKKTGIITKIVTIVVCLAPLLLSFFIMISEIHDLKSVKNEIELSTLISIELILFYLFVKTSEKNKTLRNLYMLKKDMLYGSISVDDACDRLEVIISGFRLNKVMEKEIGEIIETIYDVEEEIRQAQKYAEKARQLGNDDEISKQAFADAIRIRMLKSKGKMKHVIRCFAKFTIKMGVIVNQAEDSFEIKEMNERVSGEISKINKQLDVFIETSHNAGLLDMTLLK